jgi:hypothetical protein
MLRPQVVIAYDEKRLRDELERNKNKGRQKKKLVKELPPITVVFSTDPEQILELPLDRFNYAHPPVVRILDVALPKFGGLQANGAANLDDPARIALWTRLIVGPMGNDTMRWRMLLLEWSRRRPAPWPDQPGINKTLAEAFVREALGISDRFVRMVAAAVTLRAQPQLTTKAMMQLAFDLEKEKVTEDIVRDSAKLVVLATLLLIPFAQVPAVIAAVSTALAGFIQFMQFLSEAESKDEISEDDVTEAEWQMLGILPFDFVQLLILLRALALTVQAVLGLILQGLSDLVDSWQRRHQAAKAGWRGYVEAQNTTIFIPDYVLA